ncbi:hypothetical protein NC652_025991 [Populus alba x Populus x berolinensis]|nr:hypothetical protein NC652_025991 [Populus alba x Populus x berolinensis]
MGTSTQAYGEPWYWDNRYSSESGPFDWYQKYPSLAPLINLYIPRHVHPRILVVGCGNSAFSEEMVSDGYEDVVNIDISTVVIEAMKKKYSNHPQLKYLRNQTDREREEWLTMGTSTQAYGEPWYWDNRYSSESGPFDWYQKYPSLAPLINLYIPRHVHPRILVVGCGNSAFSEEMVSDGYEDVVNIDISTVVIEAMKKKYSNHPQLKYIGMDVRDMSEFQSGSFNAVIDKGTLDSILVSTKQDAVFGID